MNENEDTEFKIAVRNLTFLPVKIHVLSRVSNVVSMQTQN